MAIGATNENASSPTSRRRFCPLRAAIRRARTFTTRRRGCLSILFEDTAKYNAVMHAPGAILYREMRGNMQT